MNRLLTLFFLISLGLIACKTEGTGGADGADGSTDSTAVANDTPAEAAPNMYAPGEQIGSIERLDGGLDKYLDTTTPVEVLASGFEWSEGPLWVPQLNALLFSDIPRNSIMKWKEGEEVSVYLTPSGYTKSKKRGGEMGSNGLTLDSEGNLIICQHGDQRIARMEAPIDAPQPQFQTLVESYNNKKLNSPNDAVFIGDRMYFTDPIYGLEEGLEDKNRELKFQGVYRLNRIGLDLLDNSLSRPNGIGLSPDGKTLYVSNSDPEKAVWVAYDINDEGKLRNGRFFYDATEEAKDPNVVGLPDGFAVADDGTIFATGPGGIWIFAPDATVLGKINLENPASNCAIGGADRKSLFITNDMYLLRVKLK
jgi:gluconolactonase